MLVRGVKKIEQDRLTFSGLYGIPM